MLERVGLLWRLGRTIAWLTSFAIAVASAFWMRSLDLGWLATFSIVLTVWVVSSFVISQLYAAFLLVRLDKHSPRTDGLADNIVDAIKGLPPDQQQAMAKRMMDQSLK